MKPPKAPKRRNPAAAALFSSKLFRPQVVPVKKGKGVIYKRDKRDRGGDLGPFSFQASFSMMMARTSFGSSLVARGVR
jgi:stalled ribosome alternative rescue factor ArfA